MGTVSENQTQEHNKEKNRPGRKDLEAGVKSKENAPARLKGQLRDQKGTLDLLWLWCPSLRATRPSQASFRAGTQSLWQLPASLPSSAGGDPRAYSGSSRQVLS